MFFVLPNSRYPPVMLPNVCFPLFPVVDYKTLQRSIYNDDALRLIRLA